MSRDAPDVLLYGALNIEDMLCHATTIRARSRTVQKVFMIPAGRGGRRKPASPLENAILETNLRSEAFWVENKERSKKHQCAREFLRLVRVLIVSLASKIEWKLMLVCPTMSVINL